MVSQYHKARRYNPMCGAYTITLSTGVPQIHSSLILTGWLLIKYIFPAQVEELFCMILTTYVVVDFVVELPLLQSYWIPLAIVVVASLLHCWLRKRSTVSLCQLLWMVTLLVIVE